MAPEANPPSIPSDAVWIGSDHPFDLHEVYLCFRSPLWQLNQIPEKAELFITADSRYKLWVNGQFVARGPARSYPTAQAVDRLDISKYLKSGPNLLAVLVYQPGYSHFAYLYRGAAGLLAGLICKGQHLLATDASWRTRRDRSFSGRVPRVSIYGSGVEERDLNLADNWIDTNYDDSNWSPARLVAPVNGSPWTGLRLRDVPLLVERDIPATLLDTRRGRYLENLSHEPHLALREGWFSATPEMLESDEQGWFRLNLAGGEAAYWLFDMQRDYSGQGRAEIEGADGEEYLSISYAEKIRSDHIVLSDPQSYCRVRLTDRFRLRPGAQMAETFSLRGGRYLLFQLVGPTGADFRLRFSVRIAGYPLAITRPLSSSDPLLTQVIQLCETTLRACLQDGFVDSVWRESSQWLGDALPQSLTMAAMSDDLRPLRQIIEMAVQGAYPDGILPSVMPGEVHAYTIVSYNFMWVELLSLYHHLSGDGSLIEAMWPALQKMLEVVYQHRTAIGLLTSPPGRRFYVDWSTVSQNQPHAVYNLHYVLALQKAAQLATTLKPDSDDAGLWQARAHSLQQIIRQTYYRQGRWYDDQEQTTFSQQAATLALLTHTVPQEERDDLLDAIAARSLNPDDEPAPNLMVLASPFMHHYIFEALREGRRFEQVIEIIRLRWGRWVRDGYPTTWENWNVDFPDGSQCHAFSAHPRYHLAEIAREQEI